MPTALERRIAVRNAYRKFIGRNHYSQNLRTHCLTPYRDGKYYSDCSSSVCYAYKAAGEGFGILNTVGMWVSKKLQDVPVKIKNGVIQNPEVLEIGDILLFAGGDTSRKPWGYVGHVEMVGEISGGKYMLYGHGSGLAKKHEMNAYCRSRYSAKAPTPLGRRLLIRVRRAIWADGESTTADVQPEILRRGSSGVNVETLQRMLLRRDPAALPRYGIDGDFGAETEAALKAFQQVEGLPATGIYDAPTEAALVQRAGRFVKITGNTVNVRKGPGLAWAVLGVARKGEQLPYLDATDADGWMAVNYKGQRGFVRDTMGRVI